MPHSENGSKSSLYGDDFSQIIVMACNTKEKHPIVWTIKLIFSLFHHIWIKGYDERIYQLRASNFTPNLQSTSY